MKRSAGILPYKIIDNKIYVYLEHPGGPYYENVDKWSICKGEYDNERAVEAAIREFYEESGKKIAKDELKYLCTYKVSKHKLVIIFIANKDLDSGNMKSNTFKKEFPPNSGIVKEYKEMDKAEWFLIDEAYDKIFPSQKKFLKRLEEFISN